MNKSNYHIFIMLFFFAFFSAAENSFSQSFKFVAMSDSRGSYNGVNEPVLSALVTYMLQNHSDAKFLLFPGDMVNGSKTNPDETYNQLLNWKRIMSPVYNNPNMIWPKVWVTVGNHEVQHFKDEENFRALFPDVFMNGPNDEKGLSYFFDYNQTTFVFVTSDRWYYGDPDDTTDDRRDWHYIKHLDWLEETLKAARDRGNKYIFVMSHEPAFPIGGHLRDALPNLGMNLTLPLDSTRLWYLNQRDEFWRILKEYNVNAYICGHEHIYGRQTVNGVYQIVAGSCGAPLYHFNSLYGDNPEVKKPGQEMTYDESIPYYEVLNYNYGAEGNAQASWDFEGYRAFEYVVFNVNENSVKVETYGAFPKEGTNNEIGSEIELIDEFVIERK